MNKPLRIIVPDSNISVSHTEGVKSVRSRRVTPSVRRAIVEKYQVMKHLHSEILHFARDESKSLEKIGILYSPNAIQTLISRFNKTPYRLFVWEKLLKTLRTVNVRTNDFWYDDGDLSIAIPEHKLSEIKRHFPVLNEKGLKTERKRTNLFDFDNRGWMYRYRLAATATWRIDGR